MAIVPTIGDIDIAQFVVTPFDGTTTATLSVLDPAGATTHPSVSTADGGKTWKSTAITLNQPGWWVYLWHITGTGAGDEPQRTWVSPNPTVGGPLWTPDRARVASYIPGRTLVGAADGYGVALNTWDDTSTHPTGAQVDRLIADAVAWVTLKTGTVDGSLWESATACAAMYAAQAIERTYPDSSKDIAVADALYAQAVAMRDDLGKANAAITGKEPDDPSTHLVPVYAFPDETLQSPWGDNNWI